MTDDTVEMRRFRGKHYRAENEPFATITIGQHKTLQFNRAALDAYPLDAKYANYYLADDGSQVGIKPVEGGEVDDKSYAFSYDQVAFGAVYGELGLDLDESIRLECAWDDDAEMVVIDASDLPRTDGGSA